MIISILTLRKMALPAGSILNDHRENEILNLKDVTYMVNTKRIIAVVLGIAALIALGNLAYRQKVSGFFSRSYEIKGIDVSHHQNDIDWESVAKEGIDFAYIKATEGSSFVDECLEDNYQGARDSGMDYGFYHFVSFESAPKDQLENYRSATGKLDMTLIPALDAEYYGDMEKNPPPKEIVLKQIKEMEELFKEEYGYYPLIYTTQKFYSRYFVGELKNYPVWIRNVYDLPVQKWTLWQYTDKLIVDGITTFVDGNVTDEKRYQELLFKN